MVYCIYFTVCISFVDGQNETFPLANQSFLAVLPQSKTLQNKVVNFTYNAGYSLPSDFDPGVHLKPMPNYSTIATLEFRLFADGNNSTKILYEQGDVYLHGRDQLRIVPKSSLDSIKGSLDFEVECWDGSVASDAALGPPGYMIINFDSFYNSRPQLRTNISAILSQTAKVLITVPYQLDSDQQYQNGYSVGDLVNWFFVGGSQGNVLDWQPWIMGIAVLSTGSGAIGTTRMGLRWN